MSSTADFCWIGSNVVQDAVGRIVAAACAIEANDYGYAYGLLLDLEVDLENAIERERGRRLGLEDFNEVPDMTVGEDAA